MALTDAEIGWAITPEPRAPYSSGIASASDDWHIVITPRVPDTATRLRRWYSCARIRMRRGKIAQGAAARRARKGSKK